MRNARRYGVFVPVILLLLALATQRYAAANDPADSFTGFAQSSGPIQVTLTLDPPIVQPGETVTLRLSALNERGRDALPQFSVTLPQVATTQQRALPPGAALNLQSGAINWRPVLRPGVEQVLTVPFVTGSADLNRPIQTVLVDYLTDTGSQTLRADYWAGVLPQVAMDSAMRVSVGQPLPLNASVSGPGPFVQRWELGDGRIIRADNPDVSYAQAGNYTLAVEVANPLGSTRATSRVEVVPQPAAAFEAANGSAAVGQPVNFVNLSGGDGPLAYQWQFGDGAESAERTPTHTYATPGTFDVVLTVSNDLGSAEARSTITVGTAPVADMVIDAAGRAGEPVVGRAFGDETVTRYQWDLGDGVTVDGDQVTHRYAQAGQYFVQLTASNQYGDTVVADWVTIEPGNAYIFMPMVVGASGLSATDPEGLTPEEQSRLMLENFEPLSLDIADVPLDAAGVEKLMWYINKARQNYGLAPLAYIYELSVAAQEHTDDMADAGFTSHTGSDGSRPYQRQERAGYTGFYAGEATAWGFRDPSDAVEFWVNSPSHRPMVLNPLAQELGVGYTFDGDSPNIWYWTAEFGSQTVENPLPLFPTATPVPLPSPTATITATVTVTPTADPLTLPTSTPEPVTMATPLPSPTPDIPPTSTPRPAPPPIPIVTPTPQVEPTRAAEPTAEPTDAAPAQQPPSAESDRPPASAPPVDAPPAAPPPIPLATPVPFPTAPSPDAERAQSLVTAPSTFDAYTTASDFFALLAAAPDHSAAPTFLTVEARDAVSAKAGATEWLDTLLGFDPQGATVRYLNRAESDTDVTLWMTFTDRDGVAHPRTVTVISDGLAWLIAAVDPVE